MQVSIFAIWQDRPIDRRNCSWPVSLRISSLAFFALALPVDFEFFAGDFAVVVGIGVAKLGGGGGFFDGDDAVVVFVEAVEDEAAVAPDGFGNGGLVGG